MRTEIFSQISLELPILSNLIFYIFGISKKNKIEWTHKMSKFDKKKFKPQIDFDMSLIETPKKMRPENYPEFAPQWGSQKHMKMSRIL